MKLAVITGADGGMGTEITRAAAKAGYRIVMACYRPEKAEKVKDMLVRDTGNPHIEVLGVDLSSLASVAAFAEILLKRGDAAIGHLDFPDFFLRGRRGGFWRIPIYSNTKLALTLFTINLAARIRERGIVVNAADPGVVSTNIITMHMWFDPLTDIFFRPFIRTPKQGAATAIHLLLDEDAGKRTGTLNVNCHSKRLSGKYTGHVQMQELWNRTEKIVEKWL